MKQVILYRRDLKMRKGKIAAQVAHASMKVLLNRAAPVPEGGDPQTLTLQMTPEMTRWVRGRFAKIVLSVEGEEELLAAYAEAERRGLPCALITDSGKTEFHGVPTRTTVAIGPASADAIDPITGRDGLIPTRLA
ncbi:MAG: aminoacyl-tRNA hydrolase [Myxococcales bacterium]|nr:aminoacyl-tRNA hydrolase [Myxococcales bacterium]